MKTIGFYMASAASHLFPTFPLAKAFQARGHTVVYFGEDKGAGIVERESLTYIREREARRFLSRGPVSFRGRIAAAAAAGRQLLQQHKVDVLFGDPLSPTVALATLGTPIRFSYLSAVNFPLHGDGLPPPTSGLFRGTGLGYTYHTKLEWLKVWLEFWGLRTPRASFRRRRPSFLASFALYSQLGSSARQAGRRLRFSVNGPVIEYPQAILAPRELAFLYPGTVEYLGLCIDHGRAQEPFQWSGPEDKPIVFCSFGMQVHEYDQTLLARVYKVVIEVFRRRPDVQLILQIPERFRDFELAANVTCVGLVSTLAVLPRSAISIIGGGYGMVKECVDAVVPMIVIPFRYDQPANGAIVQQLKIGALLAPSELNADGLNKALTATLEPAMKERLRVLSDKIKASYDISRFAEKTLQACDADREDRSRVRAD